jgi:hypothetical protein
MQDAESVTTIVGEAREIGMTLHSPARQGGQHYDKGVSVGTSSRESRAAWLRGRRECVAKEVHQDKSIVAIPSMPQEHTMPEKLMKEVAFQQDKRTKRKFEALEFNNLCDNEVDADFKTEAEAFLKDRAKNKQAANKPVRDKKNYALITFISWQLCHTVCILMCSLSSGSATYWEPTSQIHRPTPACLLSRVWIRLPLITEHCRLPCWSELLSSLKKIL